VNLTKYQKGVYYLGVKAFNMLPLCIITEPDNSRKFKLILHKFLYEKSFYSLDENFELQKVKFNYIWSKLVFESLAHKIDMHLYIYIFFF